ncbi:MAG: YceI family protein [Brevundimonas sp.]|uniref:YceI family protein n=1 Tax=Brevundimonas sp. TaxID=1871086 RepID=UPI002735E36C|nr:YceI family protein [Brevundimonas sp.]MDP3405876.1 YceI family protein [Brevundimonas sp.]
MRRGLIAGLLVGTVLFADAGRTQERVWDVVPAESVISLRVGTPLGSRTGRFERWTGDVRFDPQLPLQTRVGIEVEAGSLRMNDAALTRTAVGANFLDGARHPTIVFRLRALDPGEGSRFTARADITMKGVTRPVVFPVTLRSVGQTTQMAGGLSLDRAAFGIGTGGPWDRLIGRQVRVDVVLTTRPAA